MRNLYLRLTADRDLRLYFAIILGISFVISTSVLLLQPAASTGQWFGAYDAAYWRTILQLLTLAAVTMTVILGLVHYQVRRNTAVYFVILALLICGVLEAFHLMLIDGWLLGAPALSPAYAESWAFTRFARLLIIGVACGVYAGTVRERLLLSPRKAWLLTLFGGGAAALVGFFALIFIGAGHVDPALVPHGELPGQVWNVIALIGFVLVALTVLPAFYLRFPSATAMGLMLGFIPDAFADLHMAFGASHIGDQHVLVACLFKLLAYALPLAGLLIDYHRSYREETDAVRQFREAEQRLKNRLMELQHSTAKYEQEEADRQSAEEAIRVLDRAIAASSCGIIITDPKVAGNQIIYVNPSFERITSYPAEEAIGRGLDFLYAQDQEQPAAQEVAEAIAAARECRVIIRNYTRTGRMFWSELDIAPVPDDNGMLSHYIGIMTDITDRVRAEEEHKKFTAKLEHTNQELADFVHVASHDLQEPLRKVQVFGDRLRAKCEEYIPEEGLLYLERMRNSVVRMDRLIRDLLTYSRIGRKEQQFTQVDLNDVVKDVLSDLEVRIEETHGVVKVESLPTLEADATQMRQLFQNLIGNALKFHRPNVSPEVRLYAEPVTLDVDSQPLPHYRLYVQDNGIGFDEKYIERIFTVFQRLHTGNRYEGTGLGLTVCRKITERHGGTIAASSEPESGATFVVTLPAKRLPAG